MKRMLEKHTSSNEIYNLKRMVQLKANAHDLQEMYELKSDKAETENNLNAIEIIHKQIKHLVMMVMESSRVLIETEYSNKQTKLNRLNNILQQSFLLTKWVMKFNPENNNPYDQVIPEDMNNFQDFMLKTMEEIPFSNVKSYENKQALSKKINRKKTIERTPKSMLMKLGNTTTKARILNHF